MGDAPQCAARLHFRAPGNAGKNETRSRSFECRQARAFGGCESVSLGISGSKRRDLTGNFTRCFTGRERSNVPRRFTDQTSGRHFTRAGNRRYCGSAVPISKRRDHSGHSGKFDRHAAAILGRLASPSSV